MAWLALTMALPFAASQGQTFLPVPLNISNTGHAVVPSIAVGPSGEIDAAWLDAGAILFRRSVNGGQTFSSTITVATTNLPSQAAQASGAQPQIAVNSGGVYVAWAGVNAAAGGDIFFSSVASGGTNWLSPVNVSNGSGMAAGSSAPVPHMTVDPSGGVDIVWGQNGAYFARSTNGTSFSGAVPLTTFGDGQARVHEWRSIRGARSRCVGRCGSELPNFEFPTIRAGAPPTRAQVSRTIPLPTR